MNFIWSRAFHQDTITLVMKKLATEHFNSHYHRYMATPASFTQTLQKYAHDSTVKASAKRKKKHLFGISYFLFTFNFMCILNIFVQQVVIAFFCSFICISFVSLADAFHMLTHKNIIIKNCVFSISNFDIFSRPFFFFIRLAKIQFMSNFLLFDLKQNKNVKDSSTYPTKSYFVRM